LGHKLGWEWLETDTLANDILRKRRHYFINKVKAPLMKVLVFIANKYPEPTRENTRKKNTHVLLDVWDDFFKYERNKSKDSLFHAIRKVIVGEYEHDGYYAQRMDWFLEELVKKYNSGEWKPLEPWNPAGFWIEPSVVEVREAQIRKLMADVGVKV